MWWMWPHLRRVWAGVGTVIAGLIVTWLYSLMSEQALPHVNVLAAFVRDYWLWFGGGVVAVAVVSVAAERAHRRHAGHPVRALSDYLPLSFRSERGAGRAQRGIPELFSPWAVTGVVLLLVAIYAIVRWRGSNASDQAAAQTHPIRSIAVLPLDNYSGDPKQEYFAEGMTDELTTDLATISALRVISRGSVMRFKGENRPPTPDIAKLLNVDAVIEGSVLRVGDKVRITAQLIDAPADKHLWAKSFERDSRDVLALQDELASAIAKEIEVQLTPDEQARLSRAPTVIPAAHDAYLKGRYFFSRVTDANFKKAIDQFNEAIKLDPNFALAYAGLSDAYLWAGGNEGVFTAAEAAAKGEETARRAVQLDDNSAEAHTSLAGVLFNWQWDWKASDAEFNRAIQLNPNYAYAHDLFGESLAWQGRFDEALAEGKRAVELDPLSLSALMDISWTLMFQGQYDAARDQARKLIDLDATSYLGPLLMGWVDIEVGKPVDATTELKKAAALDSPPFVLGYLGYAYGASGDRVHALAQIDELNKRALHGYVPAFNLAIIYLGIGDHDRAMDLLEKAYVEKSEFPQFLKVDRMFDPLRKEPRFIALLKKVHLDN